MPPGAKRSRIEAKEAKFEAFKKQQRLHPEFAGVYADTFLTKPDEMRHYQELTVCRGAASEGAVVGVLQYEPHTTVRELRRRVGRYPNERGATVGLRVFTRQTAPTAVPVGVRWHSLEEMYRA